MKTTGGYVAGEVKLGITLCLLGGDDALVPSLGFGKRINIGLPYHQVIFFAIFTYLFSLLVLISEQFIIFLICK